MKCPNGGRGAGWDNNGGRKGSGWEKGGLFPSARFNELVDSLQLGLAQIKYRTSLKKCFEYYFSTSKYCLIKIRN
jgi:hypothetical protein